MHLAPVALFGLPANEAAAIGTLALAVVALISLLLNYRLLRLNEDQSKESQGQNTATLRLAVEQLELNRVQMNAITEQAEVAQKALSLQVTPRLIPASMGSARIGPSEPIMREPQQIEITPTFLGVINAGNGVAVLDADQAEATCGEDGGRGGMGILVPPALAAGAEGQIKLTPQVGGAQKVHMGIVYNVTIPYRGSDPRSRRKFLHFTAQFFGEQHWNIQESEGGSKPVAGTAAGELQPFGGPGSG